MVAFRLTDFMGMVPAKTSRSLPDAAGAAASNVDLSAGGLRGVRTRSMLTTLDATTKRVFRIPTGALDDLASGSYWMQFTDADTDVVRTPIVNDSYERFFWCSPSSGLMVAKKADIILSGLSAGKTVGVPAPSAAVAVTPSGGTPTAPTVTRAYVMTFVNVVGEESAPSPPVEATGHTDDTWLVNSFPAAPAAGTDFAIDRRRLYRTITSASGVTEFYLVADMAVGTTSYNDTLADAQLITQLESTIWARPPSNLQGIVLMPNGILAGWVGNTVYFSENFRPHAWPAEYALTTEFPIVGLGACGSTLVVCTTGKPATVTGVKASTMALTTYSLALPCLSRRSIISTADGVLYASDPGIVQVGPAGVGSLTDELFGREAWRTEYGASSMQSILVEGAYIAVHTDPVSSQKNGLLFYPGDLPKGVSALSLPDPTTDYISVDPWSGRALLIAGTTLYEWMKPGAGSETWSWKSKEFQLAKPVNLACFQVFFDRPLGTEAVLVQVWADGSLKYSVSLLASGAPQRLPSGFKAAVWQFSLQGSVQLHSFAVAETMQELAGV